MAGRKSDFTLTKLDDLFTTQAQRDEEQLSKIRDIPLELIDDFPDHPFKVKVGVDESVSDGPVPLPIVRHPVRNHRQRVEPPPVAEADDRNDGRQEDQNESHRRTNIFRSSSFRSSPSVACPESIPLLLRSYSRISPMMANTRLFG